MRLMIAVLLALFAGMIPGSVAAQSGVGVNVGNIQIDQILSTGGSYNLPSIGVSNTGHDASDYSIRIGFRKDQEELRPSEDWFSFSPHEFRLEPGETHTVSIRVRIPITARSGRTIDSASVPKALSSSVFRWMTRPCESATSTRYVLPSSKE